MNIVVTILLVILAIVVLTILLLLLPLGIELKFDDKLFLRLKVFMLFNIDIIGKEKKAEAESKESKEEPHTEEKKEEKKKTGLSDKFSEIIKKSSFAQLREAVKKTLINIVVCLKKIIKAIFKFTKITKLDINVNIAGDDAYQTATTYGYISSVSHGMVIPYLLRIKKLKKLNFSIIPDFMHTKTAVYANVSICFSPLIIIISVVGALLSLLVKEVKIYKKLSRNIETK